jgi:hypothetical protein
MLEEIKFKFRPPPEEHRKLQEELEEDLEKYMAGMQFSFPITPRLAASVSRWPKIPEGQKLTTYRGQPPPFTELPKRSPLMSTSIAAEKAKAFTDKSCCFFEITVLPGTPFLITPNLSEYEVLVGVQGMEVKSRNETIKSVYTDQGKKRFKVIEITYGPVTTAGRR